MASGLFIHTMTKMVDQLLGRKGGRRDGRREKIKNKTGRGYITIKTTREPM